MHDIKQERMFVWCGLFSGGRAWPRRSCWSLLPSGASRVRASTLRMLLHHPAQARGLAVCFWLGWLPSRCRHGCSDVPIESGVLATRRGSPAPTAERAVCASRHSIRDMADLEGVQWPHDRRMSVCSGVLGEGVVTHECRGPVGSLKVRCNRARRGGHKRW